MLKIHFFARKAFYTLINFVPLCIRSAKKFYLLHCFRHGWAKPRLGVPSTKTLMILRAIIALHTPGAINAS